MRSAQVGAAHFGRQENPVARTGPRGEGAANELFRCAIRLGGVHQSDTLLESVVQRSDCLALVDATHADVDGVAFQSGVVEGFFCIGGGVFGGDAGFDFGVADFGDFLERAFVVFVELGVDGVELEADGLAEGIGAEAGGMGEI